MDRLPVLMFLVIAGTIGAWLLDISASAVNTGGAVVNGFWALSPAAGYHLGMGLLLGGLYGTAFLFAHDFLRGRGRPNRAA